MATVTTPADARPAAVDHRDRTHRPAARAAARVFGAGLVLGLLGLACALVVIIRVAETWRVTPQSASHHVTIVGQSLSYPTANADAIVIVALALLTAVATVRGLVRAGREAVIAARVCRRLERASIGEHDGARVLDEDRPLAFCAGLLRPRVFVSSGALAALDEAALAAVLAHERYHARRRDPLRRVVARGLGAALRFVPGVAALVARHEVLAEMAADEDAVCRASGDRSALARGMLGFASEPCAQHPAGFPAARVDYLLGDATGAAFPATLCLAAVTVITLRLGLILVVGRAAAGSATLSPPILSGQPCIVLLAAIPAAAALLVARRHRGRPRAAHAGVAASNSARIAG